MSSQSEDKQDKKTKPNKRNLEEKKKKEPRNVKPRKLGLPSSEEIREAVAVITRGFENYEALMQVPLVHITRINSALLDMKELKANIDNRKRSENLCDDIHRDLIPLLKNTHPLEHSFKIRRTKLISDQMDPKTCIDKTAYGRKLKYLKDTLQEHLNDNKVFLEQETKRVNFIGSLDVGLKYGDDVDELWRDAVVEFRSTKFTLAYTINIRAFCLLISEDDDKGDLIRKLKDKEIYSEYISEHLVVISFPDSDSDSITYNLPEEMEQEDGIGEYKVTYRKENTVDAVGMLILPSESFALTGLKSLDFFSDFVTAFVRECYAKVKDTSIPLSAFDEIDYTDRVPTLPCRHFQDKYDWSHSSSHEDPDDPDVCI